MASHPRVLLVTPELVWVPAGRTDSGPYRIASGDGFGGYQADLMRNLLEAGVDVHLAQPHFRRLFRESGETAGSGARVPGSRVHLAADRTCFYSAPVAENGKRANLQLSLAFQREVLHQILPRVRPDVVHCHGWMTGLIPAAARQYGLPSVFTIQYFDTASALLRQMEDRGIDAASFWQNLYYERYPGAYGETRQSNPADFLLSGVFAAAFATISRPAFLVKDIRGHRDGSVVLPLWEVFKRKMDNGAAVVNHLRVKTDQIIAIYLKVLEDGERRPCERLRRRRSE